MKNRYIGNWDAEEELLKIQSYEIKLQHENVTFGIISSTGKKPIVCEDHICSNRNDLHSIRLSKVKFSALLWAKQPSYKGADPYIIW